MNYQLKINAMTETELKEHITLLETKIKIYSERDWLMTEAYIQQLRLADLRLLDYLCPSAE